MGLSNPEIRRKILSRYDPDQKKLSLDKLILLVTGEESALNSAQAIDPAGSKINSVSNYKKDKKFSKNKDSEKKKNDIKCNYCDKLGHTEEVCHSKHGYCGVCKTGMHWANQSCHAKQKLAREMRRNVKYKKYPTRRN